VANWSSEDLDAEMPEEARVQLDANVEVLEGTLPSGPIPARTTLADEDIMIDDDGVNILFTQSLQ
jgi:hypothetical protein